MLRDIVKEWLMPKPAKKRPQLSSQSRGEIAGTHRASVKNKVLLVEPLPRSESAAQVEGGVWRCYHRKAYN